MISAYEQQRLDNIAENKLVLKALGLDDDSDSLKPPAPSRRAFKPRQQSAPVEGERRSARVAGKTVSYCQLSEDFFLSEERAADRPRRDRKRTRHFQDTQADGIERDALRREERRLKALEQREAARAVHGVDAPRRAHIVQARPTAVAFHDEDKPHLPNIQDDPIVQRVVRVPNMAPHHAPEKHGECAEIAETEAGVKDYHTDGEKAWCPKCDTMWVLTKRRGSDGRLLLRNHYPCGPGIGGIRIVACRQAAATPCGPGIGGNQAATTTSSTSSTHSTLDTSQAACP